MPTIDSDYSLYISQLDEQYIVLNLKLKLAFSISAFCYAISKSFLLMQERQSWECQIWFCQCFGKHKIYRGKFSLQPQKIADYSALLSI